MDLVALIAACALTAAPNSAPAGLDRNVMHVLIFEQSSGEPWSFSVRGEGFARMLPTLKDAIREARAVQRDRGNIHVGLAGLPTDPQTVSALIFAPCPNITLAIRQITQLVERCKAASKPDPIYCAIAAYHGSWDRPDTWFADAVRQTLNKGTHRTSRCRKMRISTRMTLLLAQRQLVNTQRSLRQSRRSTIASADGRVHCSLRSQ